MCDAILNKKLKEKFDESVSAALPITVIVLLLSIFVVPMETGTIALFLVGAFMLIIGMAFFQLGAEMAMTPLGEGVGSHIMKTKRLSILIIVCFVMGVIITIAEPDLQVLANQVPSIPNETLIWTVKRKGRQGYARPHRFLAVRFVFASVSPPFWFHYTTKS